uniref:MOB kinase activator 2 n=1 Tax=Mus musculus TaxID=10090 RepID=A0A1B0GT55_MOUSE
MDWLMGKSKAKPNGKKPAAEEKKVYLEPEHTKSRITDFEFKELQQHFFTTSTCSIAQSQNFAQERRVRQWLCATHNTTGMMSGGRRSSALPPSMLTLS